MERPWQEPLRASMIKSWNIICACAHANTDSYKVSTRKSISRAKSERKGRTTGWRKNERNRRRNNGINIVYRQ